MGKRTFMLLSAATLLFVVAAIYTIVTADRAAGPRVQDERVFPELAGRLPDLTWLRLSHADSKTDFTAIGGRWFVVEKGNYPAAQTKLRRLIIGLAQMTLVEPKTERPELFGRLGLDDPGAGGSTFVVLQDRLGKNLAQLLVGKARHDRLGGGNDGVYIRKPGENRTWLARGSFDLSGNVVDWLDRRIVDIPQSRIATVSLTAGEGAALVLRRDRSGGKFTVADPPEDARFKSDTVLAGPAGALAGLDLDDVRPAADLPVPDSGVLSAVFTTIDGLEVTLRLFEHDKVDWVAVAVSGSGAAEADAKAINDKLSRWVYAIAPARAKLLRTRLSDLVEPASGS